MEKVSCVRFGSSTLVGDADIKLKLATLSPVNPTDAIEHPIRHECVACVEEKAVIQIPCGDHYCQKCIIHLFTNATRNESLFPAKCCREPIPVSLVSDILGPELADLIERKAVEFATTDRTY